MIPSNHRQAERRLVSLVDSSEWEIDAEGRVWRVAVRTGDRWNPGTFRLCACARRRAENRLPSGYLMVRVMVDGVRVVGLAHRLVWQHLHGNIPDGLVVNHRNGIKSDNRPDNLEVVSYSENMSHAHRMRLLDQRGEANPAAKLSNAEVAAVREMYARGGWTMQALGERFGVAIQTISKIVKGQRRETQGGPTSTEDLRVRQFPEART